ncbi:PREDICTED: venom protease-like isoform X2 [Dinoponera quadriceps]|uniref:CLIP domain-containing serine protease n=1 Tax=Dinoponera quadriceps TaxID=609295 RepID=A0A6P3WRX9_DINQU|nr:PREDICTED: venom protease-like isoform X2 [Dinoponera quadriceps]
MNNVSFKMWSVVVTLVSVLYILIPTTQSHALCEDPQGRQGMCVNIKRCSRLLNYLQSNLHDPQIGDYLRSFSCGFEGSDPLVCCSNNGGNDVDYGDRQKPLTTEYGPLYPPECGFSNVSQHRFIGGEPAPLGAWPWITILGYTDSQDPNATRWLCGGVLISRRHVLTAGHCVHRRNDLYKVRVGDLDLNNDNDGAYPFEDFIERRVVHPQYDPTTYTNDIAVLKTTRDVPFTLKLHPICLPADSHHRNRNLSDTFPLVAGWGSISFHEPMSSHLMQIQIPIRPVQDCKDTYQNLGTTVTDNDFLCAGFKINPRKYQGDNGGPLMSPSDITNGIYYVIGVLSYSSNYTNQHPRVYTKVTSFLEFITGEMV